MSENLMAETAEILGLQLLEEFEIKLPKGRKVKAFIGESGLNFFGYKVVSDSIRNNYLAKILMGEIEIEKIPWKPKHGERYYCPCVQSRSVGSFSWANYSLDYAMLSLGMVYRTREEAEANLSKDYERLTGKKLEE